MSKATLSPSLSPATALTIHSIQNHKQSSSAFAAEKRFGQFNLYYCFSFLVSLRRSLLPSLWPLLLRLYHVFPISFTENVYSVFWGFALNYL